MTRRTRELAWSAAGASTFIAAALIQGRMHGPAWLVVLVAILYAIAGRALWNAGVLHGRRTPTDDEIEQRALAKVADELSDDVAYWRGRDDPQRADQCLLAAARLRYVAEERHHRLTKES